MTFPLRQVTLAALATLAMALGGLVASAQDTGGGAIGDPYREVPQPPMPPAPGQIGIGGLEGVTGQGGGGTTSGEGLPPGATGFGIAPTLGEQGQGSPLPPGAGSIIASPNLTDAGGAGVTEVPPPPLPPGGEGRLVSPDPSEDALPTPFMMPGAPTSLPFPTAFAPLPPWSAAYFATVFAILTLLGVVTFGVGEYRWFGYAGATLLLVVFQVFNEQKMTGIIWAGFDPPTRPFLFAAQLLPALFLLVGARAFPDGNAYRIHRRIFLTGAGFALALALFGLTQSIETVLSIYNVSILTALAVQILPLWTQPRLPGESRAPVAVAAFILAAVFVAAYAMVLRSEPFMAEDLVTLNRVGLVTLIGFGGFLSLRRIIALREDRARALQVALDKAEAEAETSRALLAAERRYQNAQEAARQQKQRFAEASHDIRQPIASLRAHIAALADGQAPETREQLQKAFDYLEHLAEGYDADPVDDPAGAAVKPAEAVPVRLLVETLDRMFRAAANEKGLGFSSTAVDAQVAGDALELMRILSNLLSNAVEHTDEGRIDLTARQDGDRIAFEVFSTGRPIAEADLERIFRSREKGAQSSGQGLGLAIVRRLSDAAGLPMDVRAEPGQGNTFGFTAPLAAPGVPASG